MKLISILWIDFFSEIKYDWKIYNRQENCVEQNEFYK